ncbi:bile-acid 7-alpha-dehydratase [Novosphingobium marinum]|uniref:SnoaL-like domain-containing protein n=1 Tax=Novosphingobium marinum TaxID=1514948 RepID=A0A7Z0BRN6_9SPHN|nr:nuclear transport factor 2 family protein [Novosphingobium marinum]NYH94011.1 hypothetical protein [Novosphingobium marinum]GGC18931.1 bile-acid 7-alpha-dehydratase [Novosphingobium marinum]
MPSTAETLLAIEEIKKLKARYFRFMDLHDWDGLAEVFAQDCVFDPHGALEEEPDKTGLEPIRGREAAVDHIRSGISPIKSAHFGHMPEIEILSDTEATGIWSLLDILRPPGGEPFVLFRGYGHYHETYSKADGTWRIASLRITRMLVEMT